MQTLVNLSSVLGKISNSYKAIAEAYGATGAAGLFELFETLGDSFQKMTESCQRMQGAMQFNLNEFFSYHSKELQAMSAIVLECNKNIFLYQDEKKKLSERKEDLFKSRSLEEWLLGEDCPYPLEVIRKNKKFAFRVMLPEDTRRLLRIRDVAGYYCNKVPEEFQRVCKENHEELCNYLIKLAQMNSGIFSAVWFV